MDCECSLSGVYRTPRFVFLITASAARCFCFASAVLRIAGKNGRVSERRRGLGLDYGEEAGICELVAEVTKRSWSFLVALCVWDRAVGIMQEGTMAVTNNEEGKMVSTDKDNDADIRQPSINTEPRTLNEMTMERATVIFAVALWLFLVFGFFSSC